MQKSREIIEQEKLLLEDLGLCSAVREELYHGDVGSASEFAEKISSFSLRTDMFSLIREYEFASQE